MKYKIETLTESATEILKEKIKTTKWIERRMGVLKQTGNREFEFLFRGPLRVLQKYAPAGTIEERIRENMIIEFQKIGIPKNEVLIMVET